MALADLRDQLQAAVGDSYHLERELAPAGMSRLFLATERSLDRQVVIKLLPPEYASDVSAARFRREITVTAHLQHPHILPILAAGARNGLLYYVMPYVGGESLRQRLAHTPWAPRTPSSASLGAEGWRASSSDRLPENAILTASALTSWAPVAALHFPLATGGWACPS